MICENLRTKYREISNIRENVKRHFRFTHSRQRNPYLFRLAGAFLPGYKGGDRLLYILALLPIRKIEFVTEWSREEVDTKEILKMRPNVTYGKATETKKMSKDVKIQKNCHLGTGLQTSLLTLPHSWTVSKVENSLGTM